jgi:hypothetical protein
MWQLRNETPFAAERTFTRTNDGSEVFVVAVRATFDIAPDGQCAPAEEQPPVLLAPEFLADPLHSSLRYDADVIDEKLSTDLVIHGSAYAPRARPAQAVNVSLEIEGFRRELRVVGDRHWQGALLGLKPSAAEPFVCMPITYDRAWGGSANDPAQRDERNPLGAGAFATVGARVPNLEAIEQPITSNRGAYYPVSLGPIPSHWEPRRTASGTYDDAWMRTRRPLRPADFQIHANHCAPVEQRLPGFLRGGEHLDLENLTPSGTLRIQIPYVDLLCRSQFGKRSETHRGQFFTVYVEPDISKLIVVWVSTLPCHHTLYELDECVVTQRRRITLHRPSASSTAYAAAEARQ